MNFRKALKLALVCAAVALVGYVLHGYWKTREPLRAKTTETRMRELMSDLDAYKPDRVDTASLRSLLLAKGGFVDRLEDGWGRPLVIEHVFRDGRPRYTIISLGRDGRRGPCCKQATYSWDDDAVLSGDQWLQVWASLKMPGDGSKP
jgi:hypothetical protein